MTRRALFARLATIAAAVALVPAVKADAAMVVDEPQSDLWFSDAAIERGDGPSGWYLESGVKHYLVDGVHQSICCPITFENRGVAASNSFTVTPAEADFNRMTEWHRLHESGG